MFLSLVYNTCRIHGCMYNTCMYNTCRIHGCMYIHVCTVHVNSIVVSVLFCSDPFPGGSSKCEGT